MVVDANPNGTRGLRSEYSRTERNNKQRNCDPSKSIHHLLLQESVSVHGRAEIWCGLLNNAYSAMDSAGIDLVLAAALIESETTQAAPAKAMLMALPAQLK